MCGKAHDVTVTMRLGMESLDHTPMQRQFRFAIIRFWYVVIMGAPSGRRKCDHMIMAQQRYTAMHKGMVWMPVITVGAVRDNDVGIVHEPMYGIAGSVGIKTGLSRFYVAIVVWKSQK